MFSKDGEWNVGKCITGEPSAQQLKPDKDLGITNRIGCRNIVRKPEDANRAFGCPTIRTDIPMKKMKSVADHQNYGDEPEAIDILFPASYLENGVSEADFSVPKDRATIKDIFEKIGYPYKIGKFNAIYNKACEYTA